VENGEVTMEIYPLEGYRVLDFGTAWAAPMATQLLADMGAEVIKIETRTRLDGLRIGRPIIGDDVAGGDEGKWPDMQPSFHGLNRNKLSFTVNLKEREGHQLILDLAARSHVVVDNFSPGVMARNGLGYTDLTAVRPDIICISLSGAGQYGPYRDATLYAGSIVALSGLGSLLGYPNEPLIGMTSLAFGDANASIHACFALMAAIFNHQETGKGAFIDLSEAQASSSLLGESLMDYFMNNRIAAPRGNEHAFLAPHGNYRCKGDDKWISLVIRSDEEWGALCEAMGHPPWAHGEEFADVLSRWNHRQELDRGISSWTLNFEPYELMEMLQQRGIAALPVMNVEDQYLDPHFRDREVHLEIEHPLVGFEVLYGIPWRISGVPREIRRPAPNIGEHSDYVLRDILGLTDEKIEELVQQKVVY
jgi:benzylsuccinate CoA-transferase BbsF subunit